MHHIFQKSSFKKKKLKHFQMYRSISSRETFQTKMRIRRTVNKRIKSESLIKNKL